MNIIGESIAARSIREMDRVELLVCLEAGAETTAQQALCRDLPQVGGNSRVCMPLPADDLGTGIKDLQQFCGMLRYPAVWLKGGSSGK